MTSKSIQQTELEQVLETGRRRANVRRLLVALIVVAVAVAAFVSYRLLEDREEKGAARFRTVQIERGELSASIAATGRVEALNTVEVGAEVSGRIAELHADFNDGVSKGELLAVIDPEQAQAAVAEAKAQVLAARARIAEADAAHVEAKLDAERAAGLAQKGLLSPRELEAAQSKAARAVAALQSARASAALAQASFTSAKTRLSKTEIRAPISGTVLARQVEVGQTINAGMTTPVLFTIAEDLRRMRLSSNVDEADIGQVTVGQSASFTVDAHPEKRFPSRVEAVHNVASVTNNVVAYEVILSVDNAELLLKPGMTAAVEIVTLRVEDALLVANRALRFAPPSEGPWRGGPSRGLPFLRGARRGGQGDKGTPRSKAGALGPRQGMLWLEEGAELRPVIVEKLATDGVRTAVSSDELREGIRVVLDLAETEGGAR